MQHSWRVDSVKCKQSTKMLSVSKHTLSAVILQQCITILCSILHVYIIAVVVFQLVSLRLTLVVIVKRVYRHKKIPVTMEGWHALRENQVARHKMSRGQEDRREGGGRGRLILTHTNSQTTWTTRCVCVCATVHVNFNVYICRKKYI